MPSFTIENDKKGIEQIILNKNKYYITNQFIVNLHCYVEDLCELLLNIVYDIIDLEKHEVGVTLKKDLSCFYLYFQGFLSRNNKE